jgi:hypothetical protein
MRCFIAASYAEAIRRSVGSENGLAIGAAIGAALYLSDAPDPDKQHPRPPTRDRQRQKRSERRS